MIVPDLAIRGRATLGWVGVRRAQGGMLGAGASARRYAANAFR